MWSAPPPAKIADVAEKYGAAAIKVTWAQRIAIVGLHKEQIDDMWRDLGMSPGHAIGLCVRSIKVCPGTTFCKRGLQDSIAMGMEMDAKYHGMALPGKFKMGVSGCPNQCGETGVKDVGVVGTARGWKVLVGGAAGGKPRPRAGAGRGPHGRAPGRSSRARSSGSRPTPNRTNASGG